MDKLKILTEIIINEMTPDNQHHIARLIASNLGYELTAATTGEDRPDEWRVGNNYGIHVYAGNVPVATFHRQEDAKRCVEAVNHRPIGSLYNTVVNTVETLRRTIDGYNASFGDAMARSQAIKDLKLLQLELEEIAKEHKP